MQTAQNTSASPQDALYYPTDVSPEQLFQALSRLRREAAAEIDRLILLLDEIDGDADMEAAGDEADASFLEGGGSPVHPNDDDEEGDEPEDGGDHEADDADDPRGEMVNEDGDGEPDREPALGWGADGEIGNTTDREMGTEARDPQNRTCIDVPKIIAERSYAKRLHGIAADQKERMKRRMRPRSGVILV